MQRRYYRLIAKALSKARPEQHERDELGQWCKDMERIADTLQAKDPRFDRRKFFSACNE